ncbi:hypothetical protein BRC82_06710 [Halobacteriales archaeon QS_1_67_19]|nr:MAG: hypothetical protein BRC82_06710 [Halobacteriales archaeon QS_1_67_19]
MTDASFRRDSRGVSVTVNYVLNLAIAALLVGGVLTATGGMVEDRRESAVRTELSVLGERIAADLMAADRLAVAGEEPTVAASVSLPDRVAATRYEVAIETAPTSRLVLRSEHPEVSVTVGLTHETPIAETTVRGGDLRIELTAAGRLGVSEA